MMSCRTCGSKAAALALAKVGAQVAVNYKARDGQAAEVCREIENRGGRAIPIQADVSVAAEVAAMIQRVEQQLGPVVVLVRREIASNFTKKPLRYPQFSWVS